MEAALSKEDQLYLRAREESDGFAAYQTEMRVGRRDEARGLLVRAIGAAAQAGEYRRLLDQLDTALLTAGKAGQAGEASRRSSCAAQKIVLGRDPLCDLSLRAGGVSRQHAEIERMPDGSFQLRDLDSRNGTTVAGLPLVGKVPLTGTGTFGLGDECTLEFETVGNTPRCA